MQNQFPVYTPEYGGMQSRGAGGVRMRQSKGAANSAPQYGPHRPPPQDRPMYGAGGAAQRGAGRPGGGQQFATGPGGVFPGFATGSPMPGGQGRRRQSGQGAQGGQDYSFLLNGQQQRQDPSQRDAFIQRINDTMAGYQSNQGVYQGEGAPPPSWGQPPQFNFPQLWREAGQMVSNGWRNPLLGLLG